MFGAGEYWLVLTGVIAFVLLAIGLLAFTLWKNRIEPRFSDEPGNSSQAIRVSFFAGLATCFLMLVSMGNTIIDKQPVTMIDIGALSVVGIMTGIFLVLSLSPTGRSA